MNEKQRRAKRKQAAIAIKAHEEECRRKVDSGEIDFFAVHQAEIKANLARGFKKRLKELDRAIIYGPQQ